MIQDNIGIQSGLMNTIHSYTNDQALLDNMHNDIRRARAAAASMIPSKTGAAASIGCCRGWASCGRAAMATASKFR